MCQPHLLYPGITGQNRRLAESHMLVSACFVCFVIFSVHSFTDKQIRFLCISQDRFCWSGICCISKPDSFSRRSKYHLRCIGNTVCFDGLPFLERIPVFQWNILLFRSLSREFPLAENLKGIAITEYIMVHFKSRNTIAI